jgi:hypothetical protein
LRPLILKISEQPKGEKFAKFLEKITKSPKQFRIEDMDLTSALLYPASTFYLIYLFLPPNKYMK